MFLEDSFVTKISELGNEIVFYMELVLAKAHPFYQPPKSGEQYCYKNGRIVFSGVTSAKWEDRMHTPFRDANNEEDFGNIDVLMETDDGVYKLHGDWGELEVISSRVEVLWD